MAKLEDYFKDKNVVASFISLITPESAFSGMRIEPEGEGSVMYVHNTPMIYFDGNTITEMYLPDVKEINEDWLPYDMIKDLRILEMPNLKKIGDEVSFGKVRKISAPNLKQVGDWFSMSDELLEFDAPQLEVVGNGFLRYAKNLKTLNVPNLRKAGEQFLTHNLELETLSLPKFEGYIDDCMIRNEKLSTLYAPKVNSILCAFWKTKIEVLDLPNVSMIWKSFRGGSLREVHLPRLIKVQGDVHPLIREACQQNQMMTYRQGIDVVQSTSDANKKTSNFIKPGDWNR
ncbi:MAG: hypothetical protein J5714_00315 [Alphaproteobacteria bacterium]|nr:hypothetical protein [Alphaproteobacteria bacterium]